MKLIKKITLFKVLSQWFETEHKNHIDSGDVKEIKKHFTTFRREIIDRLPKNTIWYEALIEDEDLSSIYLISSTNFGDSGVVDSTYSLSSATTSLLHHLSINTPNVIFQHVKKIINYLIDGGTIDHKLIMVASESKGPYTFIEGNHRAIAYAHLGQLVGQKVLLGISSDYLNYHWCRFTNRNSKHSMMNKFTLLSDY